MLITLSNKSVYLEVLPDRLTKLLGGKTQSLHKQMQSCTFLKLDVWSSKISENFGLGKSLRSSALIKANKERFLIICIFSQSIT